MSARPIGLGVIGISPHNMGSTMTLLADVPGLRFRLVAACDTKWDVLDPYARKMGIPFATPDCRGLVSRPEVEVVAVFSPDPLHAEHCIAALDAGKHVICTKPMVTSLDQARAVVDAVRRNKRKFMVGQTMRFDRQFTTLRNHYATGDLGEIMAAEAFYIHDIRPVYGFTPWRLMMPQDYMYGGVTHPVDILRSFLGDVAEVHCYAAKGKLTPAYPLRNLFFLNLKFANGVIAQVKGLYDVVEPPLPMMQVALYGTRGTAVAEFTDNKPGRLQFVSDTEGAKEPVTTRFEPEQDTSAYGHGATVIRYMRHFQECLDHDCEPSPGVLDGARACAVAAAAWKSADSGKAEAVFNDF
ncbi:MAG TPA: Gfo/Idh/MocA family oxidoreductase [Candidatus Paceibacterota bacterium]|nr:Gfo/Idh/MocA family oxidoreductase [Verrucomicrobiota bacterium]HSA12284.1 Gfo/Idh/MocA family oxidoreductase [Candidatus Paceibacterota bacterium]